MIIGAHAIIYSKDPQANRAFLRDILKFPHVDAVAGWLIFGLPPAELAVHPSDQNGMQEFFLICDDIRMFVQEMASHNISCGEIQNQSWGRITYITLPGGQLGVYQPSHLRPETLDQSGRIHE